MKKKKYIILAIGIVLVLIVGILGVSYASWRFTNVQGDFNTLGTKCFEVTLEDATSGITLPSAHPMSEEEGKNQEGYTFTVKNKCSTNAFYQVNLEELALEVKKLSNEYIKVSLNDSTGKNLNTYEEVTKTLDDAETSHKLTSGALGPAGSENDEATYTVKLWMDEDTPIVGDVMNATFKSKVSVVATYVEESDLTNEIVAETNSLSEYNTKSETIEVTVTGTNYKIIEVSEDGVNWEPLESPGTTVTIERTYTTEGTNYVYFRDEIGTVQRVELETTKLDQSAPNITASSSDTWASVNPITITLEDTKSGLAGYQITDASGSIQRTIPEPTEWISISGTTANVTYNASENKTYYIWSKDTLGNTDYKIVTISKIDTIDPVIVSITEQENYASTSIITATVKDEESGIVGYKFTTEEKEPTEWVSVDNVISETEFTYEAEVNGMIYLYIKDGAGHVVHESFEVTKVDSIAPSVSYVIANSTTGSNSWYKALTLEATTTDNESGVSSASYCITTSETCTPDTTATLTNDKYQIALGSNASSQKVCSIITDIKGNKSEVICSSAYKVDTINPNQTFAVASSTLGSNGWYKALTVQVNLTDDHSGVASAKYCITTSSCTPDTSATITNNTFTVALGSNASAQKVCVQTTDSSGRTSVVSCSNAYSVDTTNPSQSFSVASSTSGSNGWYKALTVKATLTDDHSKVASATYCITTSSCTPGTNATITNNTFNVTLSDNASAQKVCVQTTDTSGRTSTASCSTAYSVDGTKPSVSKIAASSTTTSSITVTATASDSHSKVKTYYYSKDGSTYYSSTSSSYTFTGLSAGTAYSIRVYVVDIAGNQSDVKTQSLSTTTNPAGSAILAKKPSGLNTTTAYNGMYRYTGTTANNYVSLSGVLYRIIGITSTANSTLGLEAGQLKVIKATSIGTYKWHSSATNYVAWENSDIYTYLQGSSVLGNTSVIPSGWSAKIDSVKWTVGATTTYTTAAKIIAEEDDRVTGSTSKIGLMYLSDYYYAYTADGATNCNKNACTSWMSDSANATWTMTYYGDGEDMDWTGEIAYEIRTTNKAGWDYLFRARAVRPAFYLLPSVGYKSGSGTSGDPFILA